ncbi:hypothetical protein LUZ60_017779 [Juncus effusus]|nr:hypothetical protein LUZ60_017779 [Juncus effusus]
MSYIVSKSSTVLVPPAIPTPSGTLNLSSFDHLMQFHIDFISIFSHGDKPTAPIKDAFAKALVHYYPAAGRIARMKDDSSVPVVDCTGEGIWYFHLLFCVHIQISGSFSN